MPLRLILYVVFFLLCSAAAMLWLENFGSGAVITAGVATLLYPFIHYLRYAPVKENNK
jgi:uncharacterized MnhB-related membrane protein